MAAITIIKGDDTDWNGQQTFVINIDTTLDLSQGFTAEFKLGSIIIEFDEIINNKIYPVLTNKETSTLPLGYLNGVLKIFDAEKRIRTIKSNIPFNVKSGVFSSNEDINADGETIPSEQINISISSGQSNDYNDLINKPKINGVTLIGEMTLSDLGLNDLVTQTSLNETNTRVEANTNDLTEIKADIVDINEDLEVIDAQLVSFQNSKQDKLEAGNNIVIEGNVISSIGGPGTSNYNDLTNKPLINNIELNGNKTLNEFGIASNIDVANVVDDVASLTNTVSNYGESINELNSTISNIEVNKADKSFVENELFNKQDTLTAGENITIENNVISAKTGSSSTIPAINPTPIIEENKKASDFSSLQELVQIPISKIIFGPEFNNNILEGQEIILYSQNYALHFNGLANNIAINSLTIYNGKDWDESYELFEGVTWNKETYTLTFDTLFESNSVSGEISSFGASISFIIQSGGDLIIPEASLYTNQEVIIKNKFGKSILAYSDGNEWNFSSQVLSFDNKDILELQNNGTLFGVSVKEDKVLISTNARGLEGIPYKLVYDNDTSMYYFNTLKTWQQNYGYTMFETTWGNLSLSSFNTCDVKFTEENKDITINLDAYEINLSKIIIDVDSIIPNINFNVMEDKTLLLKLDGVKTASLAFSENTLYELNISIIPNNSYILVETTSFKK